MENNNYNFFRRGQFLFLVEKFNFADSFLPLFWDRTKLDRVNFGTGPFFKGQGHFLRDRANFRTGRNWPG